MMKKERADKASADKASSDAVQTSNTRDEPEV
jgi:hypothetical protein